MVTSNVKTYNGHVYCLTAFANTKYPSRKYSIVSVQGIVCGACIPNTRILIVQGIAHGACNRLILRRALHQLRGEKAAHSADLSEKIISCQFID